MFQLPDTKRSRIQVLLVLVFLVLIFFVVRSVADWVERDAKFREMRQLVYSGDDPALERMLIDGANPNARDPVDDSGPRETLLHVAASEGNALTVNLLLQYGADPSATDRKGRTPLHYAAKRGKIDIIKRLIEEGVDLHAIADFCGDATPSVVAMDWGRSAAAKYILFGAGGGDLRGEPLERLLAMAADNDDWEMVRPLLEAGADPSAQEEWGSWPLHRAVMSGSVEPVKMLIDHGATPLESHPYSPTRLLWNAARAANPEVIQLLYDHGLAIDMKDDRGYTALHHAAQHTEVQSVEYLIELGADVNARADLGETPLYAAVGDIRLQNVQVLLDHGADASIACNGGDTPLNLAKRVIAEGRMPSGTGYRSTDAADILQLLQTVSDTRTTTDRTE